MDGDDLPRRKGLLMPQFQAFREGSDCNVPQGRPTVGDTASYETCGYPRACTPLPSGQIQTAGLDQSVVALGVKIEKIIPP